MVVPEVGQHLFELAITVDRAQQLALGEILIHHLHRAIENLNSAPQIDRGGCI